MSVSSCLPIVFKGLKGRYKVMIVVLVINGAMMKLDGLFGNDD